MAYNRYVEPASFHLRLGGHLEAILGTSWGLLGVILGPLGAILGAILGPSWGLLGSSWGRFGVILELLAAILTQRKQFCKMCTALLREHHLLGFGEPS